MRSFPCAVEFNDPNSSELVACRFQLFEILGSMRIRLSVMLSGWKLSQYMTLGSSIHWKMTHQIFFIYAASDTSRFLVCTYGILKPLGHAHLLVSPYMDKALWIADP